jgi:hypothetical protein
MKDDNANAGLRQEIIESQKTQADFLKWKLIAVALLSSIALGFSGPSTDSAKFLICLIPLLCGYVDLISLHLMIRIITIGVYLRASGSSYEEFAFKVRDTSGANPFVFEPGALHGSSLIFNGLIIVLGVVLNWRSATVKWPEMCATLYVIAGVLGLVWTMFLWFTYVLRVRQVKGLGEQLQKAEDTSAGA